MATPRNLLEKLAPFRIDHRPSCPVFWGPAVCLCDWQERQQMYNALVEPADEGGQG